MVDLLAALALATDYRARADLADALEAMAHREEAVARDRTATHRRCWRETHRLDDVCPPEREHRFRAVCLCGAGTDTVLGDVPACSECLRAAAAVVRAGAASLLAEVGAAGRRYLQRRKGDA